MFTSEDKLFAHGLGVKIEEEGPDFVAVCRWAQKAKGTDLALLLYVLLRRLVQL